jgi:hypothetical protein
MRIKIFLDYFEIIEMQINDFLRENSLCVFEIDKIIPHGDIYIFIIKYQIEPDFSAFMKEQKP